MSLRALPPAQGLYDPANEHDACGVGFVCHIKNHKSHGIVRQGLELLERLTHRGAVGADPKAGDGAGILVQIPDAFFRAVVDFELPPAGSYGVGMVFLPKDESARRETQATVERHLAEGGQRVLGWRDVPVDNRVLGESVLPTEPVIRQVFVACGSNCPDQDAFERKLFVVRKRMDNEIRAAGYDKTAFYVTSMSSRTIVYKGMLLADQVGDYYQDLQDERFDSALALVHQRFSTNTFPTWDLAHPFRMICHNGEINTLRGNVNWMAARRHTMSSEVLGEDLDSIWPLIPEGQSDSACFDNALELLVMGGYSLAHAMMILIPEAWAGNKLMDDERRAFYEYHAALMEPWDGPAAVAFTDGRQIGATLDRNGLRPARYLVTNDDLVVMASEMGVLDIPEERIVKKWRLQPGKMFLIDLEQGRIIDDAEIKAELAAAKPYREWLHRTQIHLDELPTDVAPMAPDVETLLDAQQAFGYTQEDIKFLLTPMVVTGQEAVGSMGADNPPSVLSRRPKHLSTYFKQNFAQVTNPPIDPIREELVMSLVSLIGPRPNLLGLNEAGKHWRLEVNQPVLTNEDLERVRHIEDNSGGAFRTRTLHMVYPADEGAAGMGPALERLCSEAEQAVLDGYNILILSDRNTNRDHIAIPALLATSAVHHHLIRQGMRTSSGLVVETGAALEVHHFAVLAGYGAEAINPYLAFDTIQSLLPEPARAAELRGGPEALHQGGGQGAAEGHVQDGHLHLPVLLRGPDLRRRGAEQRLHRAATSPAPTPPSRGSAWSRSPRRRCAGTARASVPSRSTASTWTSAATMPSGCAARTTSGPRRPSPSCSTPPAPTTGRPTSEYSRIINEQNERLLTFRGLMDFKWADTPVPLEEVEPAKEIVKRFATGAMSFGSICYEAHSNLARAMNAIGGKSNTGEGGEEPERFQPLPDGSRNPERSAIKQVASGRFGVTTEYLVNADDIQIKIAQGAKPGEGGQLPGHKVNAQIARVRHSTPGVGLISPPPHHDIYSIEDLAQLIHDLKNVNPRARISVKLVSEVGVGTVAAGVSKAHADHVTIAGYDGGTGASPLTSIKHAGSPWEIGLAETHQTLVLNRLRGRIAVQVDGGMRTGRDVVIGALLGADEFGFATAPLIVSGCIMMRKCHLNTCPVGVATQDPELRKRFTGKPEHVINYFFFVAEEVRRIMARLGFRTVNEMIGQSDRLEMRRAIDHWKAQGLDFSPPARQAQGRPGGRRLQLRAPGPRPRPGPGSRADRPGRAGPGARRAGPDRDRRQELQPHLRHHALGPGRRALRPCRASRRHHPHQGPGHRRPVLRGLAGPGRHHRAGGRGQRLRRQGPLRRAPDHLSPAPVRHGAGRGQHHRRQYRALRGHQRRVLLPRGGRRALLRAQLRRHRRGRGRRRPRLRVHDRRHRRGPGAHRAQLRRRHVRRHRLCARRGRGLRGPLQPGHGGARAHPRRGRGPGGPRPPGRRPGDPRSGGRQPRHDPARRHPPAAADRAPPALHQLRGGAAHPRRLGELSAPLRQGHAGGLPPGPGGDAGQPEPPAAPRQAVAEQGTKGVADHG